MKKKTVTDAKKQLRLCHAADTDWGQRYRLWYGYACDLCCNCCPECGAPGVLEWIWPELQNFREVATEEEWKAWAAKSSSWQAKDALERIKEVSR